MHPIIVSKFAVDVVLKTGMGQVRYHTVQAQRHFVPAEKRLGTVTYVACLRAVLFTLSDSLRPSTS